MDITELKLFENKIKDLAKFPEENPFPVMRIDEEKILYANNPAKKMLNLQEEKRIPPFLNSMLKEVKISKSLQRYEQEINNRYLSIIIAPIEGESYYNIYCMDITKRKLAEKKLTEFISNISHEIKTPLTAIMQSIENLKRFEDSLTVEQKKDLYDTINQNLINTSEIIQDLLLRSYLDEKKIKLNFDLFKVDDLVKSAVKSLAPQIKIKNIDLTCEIGKDLIIRGDYKRIEQVLRIILSNAVKYTKNRGSVKIEAHDYVEDSLNVGISDGTLIRITDDGIGIDNEDLSHLFERYFRGKNVKQVSGTGLGLPIAKELMELHSSKIHVESEIGKGSSFSLIFPNINLKEKYK